ncbi:MAG: DsbA family protein [Candidatus Nanohalobium sp.]
MAENYTCDKCGEEFDSERGLHIHIGQVHDQEIDTEKEKAEDVEVLGGEHDESEEEGSFPLDAKTVQVPVELALLSVFVLGIAVGLSSGLMVAGSGFSLGTMNPSAPSGADNGGSPTGSQDGGSGVSVADLSFKDDPVMGQEDAPVTMVMWEDFECPFCKRFEQNTFPRIKTNYIDTGKVKVVWKDFPLPERIHPWADEAAYAMECVYREGGNDVFWSLKKKIFDNQATLTKATVQDQIKTWAAEKGVSKSAVQSCLDSGVKSEIQEDMKAGQTRGISGTPGFLIYKSNSDTATKVVGSQPYSRFVDVFKNKLK